MKEKEYYKIMYWSNVIAVLIGSIAFLYLFCNIIKSLGG